MAYAQYGLRTALVVFAAYVVITGGRMGSSEELAVVNSDGLQMTLETVKALVACTTGERPEALEGLGQKDKCPMMEARC
jgi:hypothetical protein